MRFLGYLTLGIIIGVILNLVNHYILDDGNIFALSMIGMVMAMNEMRWNTK